MSCAHIIHGIQKHRKIFNMGLSKNNNWKEKGLKVANSHKGKLKVYEAYQERDPNMADEYLKFLAKQPDAVYISWDEDKGRFVA